MSIRVVNDAERSRASNAQRAKPMRASAFRKEMLIACAYLVAALALPAAVGVDGSFSPTTAALYVIGIAVASQVRFEIGAGFTVPIQVLFVPFLFAVPPSLGPLLIPVALLLGMTQRVLRREISPSWLLTAVGNSYFAIGPA